MSMWTTRLRISRSMLLRRICEEESWKAGEVLPSAVNRDDGFVLYNSEMDVIFLAPEWYSSVLKLVHEKRILLLSFYPRVVAMYSFIKWKFYSTVPLYVKVPSSVAIRRQNFRR